jgi:hypothetical protein
LLGLFQKLFSHSRVGSEGSLLVSIEQALERVRQGPHGDEAAAMAANKIVRSVLDKRAITYAEYKVWRKHNRQIFTIIVDDSNQMIGFFDIFPLTTEAGEAIVNGHLTERSLTLEHILSENSTSAATHVHIATVLLNPGQRSFSPIVAKEVLLLKLKEFIELNYAPIETRTFTAFAQSKAGEAFLQRCDFSMVVFPKDNDQNLPLYVLRPTETDTAIARFGQAAKRFQTVRRRKASLVALDQRIETIELRLRSAIDAALGGNPQRLPSHVMTKINQRIRDLAKKDPVIDIRRYKRLLDKLEFCDVRELQDTMLNSGIWPNFRGTFVNQETLAARFGKLADLRNALRHSRVVDDITEKDGEAAIMWFERVLAKTLEPDGLEDDVAGG